MSFIRNKKASPGPAYRQGRLVGLGPKKSLFWQAVGLVFQFGYTITVPLILFALLGRLLDKALNSSPIIFLIAIVFSIVISSVLLFIKVKNIMIEIK